MLKVVMPSVMAPRKTAACLVQAASDHPFPFGKVLSTDINYCHQAFDYSGTNLRKSLADVLNDVAPRHSVNDSWQNDVEKNIVTSVFVVLMSGRNNIQQNET